MPGTESSETVQQRMFGLDIDAITLNAAVARCMAAIPAEGYLEVGVVNAAKIVRMRTDTRLHAAVAGADLVLADGQSVVWASRFLGRALPERVAGIDLFTALLAASERQDRSVFLLGAKPEVLRGTVAAICRQYPRLRIAGARDGYFDNAQAGEVADSIRESSADLLFLGMTSPKKELFCAEYAERSGASVIHGVGGSFDVLAGLVRRAPQAWQTSGFEWLYRLLQEPRRLGPRYLSTNIRFILMTLVERLRPARSGPRRRLGWAANPAQTSEFPTKDMT